MNKTATFAGSFYPEKAEELTNLLNSYMQEGPFEYKSKAIITPHAGVYYSGNVAMSAFQRLEINDNIFIILFMHYLFQLTYCRCQHGRYFGREIVFPQGKLSRMELESVEVLFHIYKHSWEV